MRIVFALLLCLPQDPPSVPEVTLNEERYAPASLSLDGDSGAPEAGDVLYLGRVPIVYDGAAKLRVRFADPEDGRVLLDTESGPRAIAATVSTTFGGQEKIVVNPLASMSDAELAGLRGLTLQHWSEDVAEKLKKMDLSRLFLTITGSALLPGGKLPPLPPGVRYLRFHIQNLDPSALTDMKDLRFLQFEFGTELDASQLRNARHLRVLLLGGVDLTSPEKLGSLAELRVLRLGFQPELMDIAFAKDLLSLRSLDISRTSVQDLSPLAGLKRLREVDADFAPVARLPENGCPSLERIRLLGSALSAEDVDKFAKARPTCEVLYGWKAALRRGLAGATRLRIRAGGTCHRDGQEATLFETADPALLRELVDLLVPQEKQWDGSCMCCGEPTLEFYAQGRLIASLGVHHGRSIRWEGWPSDGRLTEKSGAALVDWLAVRGVTGPRDEIEGDKKEASKTRRIEDRGLASLSKPLREAWEKGREEFAKALAVEKPDAAEQIRTYLRILGATNATGILSEEPFKAYARETLQDTVAQALLSHERPLRRGAARLWSAWKSPLKDWTPREPLPLRRAWLDVHREERYVPARMKFLWKLEEWKALLPPEDVDARLLQGFSDPSPTVRRLASIVAGKLRHEASIPLLIDLLKGQAPAGKPLPDVPAEETEDIPEPTPSLDEVAGGKPEDEVAALALGWLGHAPAADMIRESRKASPLFDVALALLGEPARLRPVHFTTPNNTELQLAAVEAVLRCKGEVGLEWALNYRQSLYWWEEDVVAQQLVAFLKAERAPGAETISSSADLKALQGWHKAHGAEFAKRFKR